MTNGRTHPGEDLLLRFCDGELRTRDAGRVASHLEACWECRTRLEDLKKTIGDYVHYRSDVLLPGLPPPPVPWQGLEPAFQRLKRDESGRRGGFLWRSGRGAWLLAGATAVLAAGIGRMIVVSQPAPVAPERNQSAKIPAVAEHAINIVAQKLPQVQPDREPQLAPAVGPEDELRVIAALHQVGADLGDPVDIVRKPDQILVTAAGLDPQRLEAIRAALAGLSRVSLETPTQTPPRTNQSSPDAPASTEPSLLQLEIPPAEFQRISNAVLGASEAMMARAFALRNLADRFPPDAEMELTEHGREELSAIRNQHVAAFSEQIIRIDRTLKPVVAAIRNRVRTPGPAEAQGSWQQTTQRLFPHATRADRMLATILVAPKGDSDGESIFGELAGLLGELEQDASSYRNAQ